MFSQRSDILVYIAGPLTGSGRLCDNIRTAALTWYELRKAGLTPIAVHTSYISEIIIDEPPLFWLDYDFHLLQKCQILLRLPGFSPGSDIEEIIAKHYDLKVCFSIKEVIEQADLLIKSIKGE